SPAAAPATGPLASIVPWRTEVRDQLEVWSWLGELGDLIARRERALGAEPLPAPADHGGTGPQVDSVLLFCDAPARDVCWASAPTGDVLTILVRTRDRITARVAYRSGHLTAQDAAILLRQLLRALSGLAHAAQEPVSAVTLADQEDQLLADRESRRRPYATDQDVCSLVAAQVCRAPAGIACVQDGISVSYGQLHRRVMNLAGLIRTAQPHGPAQEMIGLMADKSVELAVGMLGILESGNAFLPLDANLPVERLRFMLSECTVRILITEDRHRDRAEALASHVGSVECVISAETGDAESSPTPRSAHGGAVLDDVCYVIYTSGSTGVPKGVAVTHRNLAPKLAWARECFPIGQHTRALQQLSHAFDFGTWDILTTLCVGGTLYFIDRRHSSAADYAAAINRYQINTLNTTPTFFAELLTVGHELPSLRLVHVGGEEATAAMLADARRLLPPECQVYNGYGPTEATVNSVIYAVDWAGDWRSGARVPIGFASGNDRLYVLSGRMARQPIGVPGELAIGGDSVSRGYLCRPGLTAERFVPDPFSADGRRMYRTGDYVRQRGDGALEFLGRMDQQVKLRGYRIELGEIEAVLLRHPGVAAAAVTVHEPRRGQRRLVGHLVPAGSDHAGLAGRVRAFSASWLPYYMVPSALVLIDHLPLTPNGKLDRAGLASAEPAGVSPESTQPRDPTEARLVRVWADVLGAKRIGIHDNFYDLGGDSLLAMRICDQARATGLALSPEDLLESQTVAELARALRFARSSSLGPEEGQ
ncbi:MAG: non-ribosomal peptide synthetase, partial [Streptosporangiaceae bacterium]